MEMKKILDTITKVFSVFEGKKIFGYDLTDFSIKTLMVFLLVVMIVSMMPSQRPFEYGNMLVGSIAQEEIIAPFTFPIIKTPQILQREREEAQKKVPPVFQRESGIRNIQSIKMNNLLSELSTYLDQPVKASNKRKKQGTGLVQSEELDSLLNQLKIKYNVQLTVDDVTVLYRCFQEKRFSKFSRNLIWGFDAIYDKGLISLMKREIQKSEITIIYNGMEELVGLNQLYDIEEAETVLDQFLKTTYPENEREYRLSQKMIFSFLIPDVVYNSEITRSRKEKALREVPATSGFVHENQRIIDGHEIVTEDIYQKLQSLALALSEKSATMSNWYRFLFLAGKYIFALLITLVIAFYLYYYQPKIFSNNKLLWLITCIFLIQFLASVLVKDVLHWSYMSIPITLGPMLLSMLLDSATAFTGTIIMSLVLGAAGGNNFQLALMAFVVGTVGLFSVQKIRNRGQMFRAILYIMIGYAAVNFSMGFIHYESFGKMVRDFVFYQVPNAILVPTAVFLLIGVFEKFFDVTTDITLLELSDLNNPLLKRLSVEAPGTFHHSIIVGNLAEAAAKEIGANSLLARVGCYYHDIGKMLLSEYFVENQSGSISKHEALTPSMSSLILAKHVRAGMDLAEQYGLPMAVRKFIPEHHGTSIMSYFYHKAQETMEPKDLNENDFRYPGPRPQSRETAIAMLSDTVEAASRSLPNPNIQRISGLVDNLIEKRFQEGELDECDVTLRELNKIKGAFIRVLMGIHHLRIEYPSDDKSKEKTEGTERPKVAEAEAKGVDPERDTHPDQAGSKSGEMDSPKTNKKVSSVPNKSNGRKKENPN